MNQLIKRMQATTIERRRKAIEKYSKPNLYTPTDKEVYDFYHDKKNWGVVREEVLRRDKGIDQIELVDFGRIIPGNTVHHIVPLREAWEGRLDPENLETTSPKNHNREHPEKGNKNLVGKRRSVEALKVATNVIVSDTTEEL